MSDKLLQEELSDDVHAAVCDYHTNGIPLYL